MINKWSGCSRRNRSTMNIMHLTRHFLLLFLLATAPVVYGANINSIWTGSLGDSSQNWTDSQNWNPNVIPNNGGGDLYHVTITAASQPFNSVALNTDITIQSLGISQASLSIGNASLTIAEELDLSGTADNTSLSVMAYANLANQTATVTAATNSSMAGNTLQRGYWEVSTFAMSPFTATASIGWSGADIQVIGADAEIRMSGAATSFRNSDDDSDALAGLANVEGTFSIANRNFTTAGDFSNTGAVTVQEDNNGGVSVFAVTGANIQQVGTTLVDGFWGVAANLPTATATIAWSGADIETIGEQATVSLRGTNASIRNSDDDSDALADISSVQGELDISLRNFTTTGDLSNTGAIYVESIAYNNDPVSATFTISGTVAQQIGTTLQAGNWGVRAYSEGGGPAAATIEWNGANIQTIAAAARVSLSGENTSIRNTVTSANALADLSSIAGIFEIADGAEFNSSGDIAIEEGGVFIISNGADADVNPGSSMTVSGRFELSGPESELRLSAGGDLIFESSATVALGFSEAGPAFGTGLVTSTAGSISLDGIFTISFQDVSDPLLLPSPSDVFTIFQADLLTGSFANIADGNRLNVTWYNPDTESYEIAGSFVVDYSSTALTLSDYQAIPEPRVCALLALGFMGLLLIRKRHLLSPQHGMGPRS